MGATSPCALPPAKMPVRRITPAAPWVSASEWQQQPVRSCPGPINSMLQGSLGAQDWSLYDRAIGIGHVLVCSNQNNFTCKHRYSATADPEGLAAVQLHAPSREPDRTAKLCG